jgi:hypothetical protein
VILCGLALALVGLAIAARCDRSFDAFTLVIVGVSLTALIGSTLIVGAAVLDRRTMSDVAMIGLTVIVVAMWKEATHLIRWIEVLRDPARSWAPYEVSHLPSWPGASIVFTLVGASLLMPGQTPASFGLVDRLHALGARRATVFLAVGVMIGAPVAALLILFGYVAFEMMCVDGGVVPGLEALSCALFVQAVAVGVTAALVGVAPTVNVPRATAKRRR